MPGRRHRRSGRAYQGEENAVLVKQGRRAGTGMGMAGQKQKRPLYERSFCLAPQTEIPLTGEMSRSDKRVTARYEQLEPVTLNMLSATAVASLYRNAKTIHRIVLSATDNSRVWLL